MQVSPTANPFADSMDFMQRIQEQYHTTLAQMSSGLQANAELWTDSHSSFSKFWLESVENLSFALLPMDSMPKFDALMGFDLKVKDFAVAATNLSIAATELQMLFLKIWAEAYEQYRPNSQDSSSTEGSVNSWLDNANQIVMQFQQSEQYLEAKKKYATSLTSFQTAYKKLVEIYQENNHMPTQAEFDDLSNSVYQLKKELRLVKKEMKSLRGVTGE